MTEKIPYYFDTPSPSYFRKNGWFKNPKSRAFISWCFERCSSETRDIEHDGQRIILKPYQFIFGRRICSEETGLTEMEIRIQQNSMEKALYLKKAPNKTPNRFTIYEWSKEVFLKNHNQQNNQLTTNKQPTDNHNLAYRSNHIEKQQQPQTPSKSDKVVAAVFFDNKDFEEEYFVLQDSQNNIENLSDQNCNITEKNGRNPFIFQCLVNIKDPSISEEDKINITSKYLKEEQRVIDAVSAVTSPSFIPQISLLKSLWSACKGSWKPTSKNSPSKNDEQKNRKLAQAIESLTHKTQPGVFVYLNSAFEIVLGPYKTHSIKYEQSFFDFSRQVEQKGNIRLQSNKKTAKFLTETWQEESIMV